jgi:methylene-fatty-acyl-phospholipid synthase
MSLWSLIIAAILLSLERLCYAFVWRWPRAFVAFCNRPVVACAGEPVDVLRWLFYGFKGMQLGVFIGWCYVYGHGTLVLPGEDPLVLSIGGGLIIVGQLLNFGVFYRLGKVGVFYGNKFGYHIPWQNGFPFSFLKHPQYVGTLCSIWGFFLAMRFPHDDWYVLPLLETVYYTLGAYIEQ